MGRGRALFPGLMSWVRARKGWTERKIWLFESIHPSRRWQWQSVIVWLYVCFPEVCFLYLVFSLFFAELGTRGWFTSLIAGRRWQAVFCANSQLSHHRRSIPMTKTTALSPTQEHGTVRYTTLGKDGDGWRSRWATKLVSWTGTEVRMQLSKY